MRKSIAVHIFNALVGVAGVFQLALALGMPWGELAWGGAFPGVLPDHMRVASVFSAFLLLVFATVVSIRAGLVFPRWQRASRKLVWGVVAYCALGVVANAITPSFWERIVWLPLALILLASAVVVARD